MTPEQLQKLKDKIDELIREHDALELRVMQLELYRMFDRMGLCAECHLIVEDAVASPAGIPIGELCHPCRVKYEESFK